MLLLCLILIISIQWQEKSQEIEKDDEKQHYKGIGFSEMSYIFVLSVNGPTG